MALVEYEVKDRIAFITLNRPEKLNSINKEMFQELVSVCKRYDEDRDALVAIFSGKGRGFCSGADLGAELGEADTEFIAKVDMLYLDILSLKKPTIAAVHGFCLAQGLGITLCSDIRIGAEGTKFGWPQVKRGISSISGPAFAVHYLPRNFGYEYLFTGEFFSTEEAFRFNMLNRIVPEERLMPTAEEMARKIAANAPLAVQAMKEAALLGQEMNLAQRLRVGGMILARIIKTKDAEEGLRAFQEKREPVWRGE